MAAQQKKRIVLNIGGMHCATCVQTIEKRLPKVKGVIYATINLAAEKAIVDYDPTVVDQQRIEDAITDVGYRVIHQEVTFKLSGMHCTMCAQAIEKALNKKEGVYKAVVNFATETAFVEFNPGQVSLEAIKKAIREVGYDVVEPEGGIQDAEQKERENEIRSLKIRLTISAVASVVAEVLHNRQALNLNFPINDSYFPIILFLILMT